MRHYKHLPIILGLPIAVGVVLTERPVGGDPPKGFGDGSSVNQIAWRLIDARVANHGQRLAIPQGTIIKDYRIQATAVSIGDGPYRRGTFDLSATLFTPKIERPRQERPGPEVWYLNGAWTILDRYIIDRARDPSYPAAGRIQGKLDFNPAAQPGLFQAEIVLTTSLADSQPLGQGTFSGNERFEGMLSWAAIEPGRSTPRPKGSRAEMHAVSVRIP